MAETRHLTEGDQAGIVATARNGLATQAALDAEANTRQQADLNLNTSLGQEQTARINADNALGGRIDNEADARHNADQALAEEIDQVASDAATLAWMGVG